MYITDFHPQVNGNSTHKTEKKKIKLGWIPREMILGEDAQKRVPDEFITQRLNIANPPTFLVVLESLISRYFLHSEEAEDCSASNVDSLNKVCSSRRTESFIEEQANKQEILRFLYHVFSRLHYWIEWFRISQASSDATSFPSFRWRGRSYHDNKVIPNTLSSGLDDYPRAIYPVPEERHVDLLCWMIKAYKILDQIAVLLNHHYPTRFQKEILTPLLKTTDTSTSHPTLQYYEGRYLAYNRSLFVHHYSSEYRGFYDFGINNESSVFLKEVLFRCHNPETKSAIDGYIPIYYLQNKIMNFCPESHPQPLYPMSDGQGGYTMRERVVAENFNYTVVPRIGYVNLFPFLLKLLPITAEKEFDEILAVMEDPQLLFTNYGLRSMATTDKFYLKRNAPGDAPYWRGPIWINMNYLALSALHYYGKQATIHQERINTLYHKLRNGLLDNILKEHQLTGYYWEQYDDQTGKGIRGHPFTGWTATVVNIFFEWY